MLKFNPKKDLRIKKIRYDITLPHHKSISSVNFDQKKLPKYLTEIVLALEAIHKAGIIHCNLKPKHILLTEDDQIKIRGFHASLSTETKIPPEKKMRGDPNYAAPESILFQKYSEKSDLWQLGCVFYELKYKERLFKCPYQLHYLEIPPGFTKLDEIIFGLLRRNPKKRLSIKQLKKLLFKHKLDLLKVIWD